MKKPEKPGDEAKRLQALRALAILDSAPEERFDRYTRLAQRSFNVPVALVSLVDAERQWFKSNQGLAATETSRDVSFCGHAVLEDAALVIPDTFEDERFADNPLVVDKPNIRFYAGRPLAAPDGSRVGTLCLIDRRPRTLDAEDLELLDDLGAMVEDELAMQACAITDELTGLSNRRGFFELARRVVALCLRLDKLAALLFIDVDNFKSINDTFGHHEGDRALRELSALLLETFRDTDVIGRLGGDEFCVLLAGAGQSEAALERMQERLRKRNAQKNTPYPLSCSIGRATFNPNRHRSVEDLLNDADQRMYEAKRTSKLRDRKVS